jgi:hypothetical protein
MKAGGLAYKGNNKITELRTILYKGNNKITELRTILQISVIAKLPNSEQSYKGKVSKYYSRSFTFSILV